MVFILPSFGQKLALQSIIIDTATFPNGRLPFTSQRFNDREDKIQFAIISDLHGGNIPGVFLEARDKLNKLQPSFVLSIGDLIDGYTMDSALVQEEWSSFTQKVDSLTMPFFYVSGNHDVSNNFLKQQWIKRFGRTYYYFLYKNALFLMLDTEDGNTDGVSKKQSDYIRKVINDHQNVRWTFVFMHRPLWSYGNEEGYDEIEQALKGREYTVFSGHHHNYLMGTKNGQNHYVLATTGGGTNGRGVQFGEFQHITWVTLSAKKPDIINIALDGLIKDDIVTTKIYPEIQTLRMGTWLKAKPFLSLHHYLDKAPVILQFTNLSSDYPLVVRGKSSQGNTMQCNPDSINVIVPAKSRLQQIVTYSNRNKGQKFNVDRLEGFQSVLTGTYRLQGEEYSLAATAKFKINCLQNIPILKKTTHYSYHLNSDTTEMIAVERPEYVAEDWDWHGPEDALIKFKLQHDSDSLYINVLVKDDKFVLDKNLGDQLELYFQNLNETTSTSVIIKPMIQGEEISTMIPGITQKSEWLNNHEWFMHLTIPLKYFNIKDKIRFNISYKDVDDLSNTKPSVIFWKPKWLSQEDYFESGTFQFIK